MLGNINKNTGEAEICNNDGINKECILFQDNIIITNWRNDETKNLIIEINSSKERDHYNE
jgi:bisphosphoglycerate-independent phosphoglycerate mutase (AlkP superfamily)